MPERGGAPRGQFCPLPTLTGGAPLASLARVGRWYGRVVADGALDHLAAAHRNYIELKREADEWVDRLKRLRDDAVVAARDGGYTQQQIADAMGVSRPRAQQILDRLKREGR